jgi:hypothetical protein
VFVELFCARIAPRFVGRRRVRARIPSSAARAIHAMTRCKTFFTTRRENVSPNTGIDQKRANRVQVIRSSDDHARGNFRRPPANLGLVLDRTCGARDAPRLKARASA